MSAAKYIAWLVITYLFGYAGSLVLWYASRRMWQAIQLGGTARTTPNKAFWLQAVPLYSLYWSFQVFWGYARDYNELSRKLGDPAVTGLPKLQEGLFLVHSVLYLLMPPAAITAVLLLALTANAADPEAVATFAAGTVIYLLAMLLGIASIIVDLVMLSNICDSVNRLADFRVRVGQKLRSSAAPDGV